MHFTQYQICYKHDYKMNTINKIPCIPHVIIQLYSLIVLQVHVYFSSDVIFVDVLLLLSILFMTEANLMYQYVIIIIKYSYLKKKIIMVKGWIQFKMLFVYHIQY